MEATQALLLANIKRIRKEKGMSQKDVAERADMLVPTYSRLERGGTTPGLGTMVKIASALEISILELFQSTEIKDRSIAQKLEMIENMEAYNKQVVEIMIDNMLEKDKLEKQQKVVMDKRLKELDKIRKNH
ncbi:helix-turn-helix domain-containing protein [Pontimicrobium sp. MEBiC01747]